VRQGRQLGARARDRHAAKSVRGRPVCLRGHTRARGRALGFSAGGSGRRTNQRYDDDDDDDDGGDGRQSMKRRHCHYSSLYVKLQHRTQAAAVAADAGYCYSIQ